MLVKELITLRQEHNQEHTVLIVWNTKNGSGANDIREVKDGSSTSGPVVELVVSIP